MNEVSTMKLYAVRIFVSDWERACDFDENAAGLSLQVDDIEGTDARLKDAGVEFTSAPEKQPWGGSLAHFRDPDRNVLTLLG